MKQKFLKQIRAIKTENDLKDAHIAVCQACSNYELSWADFTMLCGEMRKMRKAKNIKWGASI